MNRSGAYGHRDHERVVWSLLASVILNLFIWVLLSRELSRLDDVRRQAQHEAVFASTSSIRIERRTVPRPPSPMPRRATLALPPGWTKQQFEYRLWADTTLWLDWRKHSGTFIPRVFLSQMKTELPYMRRPSLQDAVADIVGTLRAQNARVYASRVQSVCEGRRPGWFVSYVKPGDDPPIRVEETLFMAGDMIYRALYVRPDDQPEDTETREALNTLC
jgi:hypothetical protein